MPRIRNPCIDDGLFFWLFSRRFHYHRFHWGPKFDCSRDNKIVENPWREDSVEYFGFLATLPYIISKVSMEYHLLLDLEYMGTLLIQFKKYGDLLFSAIILAAC